MYNLNIKLNLANRFKMKTKYLLAFMPILLSTLVTHSCQAMDTMESQVSSAQASFSLLENLIIAIREHNLAQVQLITAQIIASGQSLNQVDTFGNTPLIWAVRCHDEQIVQHLVSSGADVNFRNEYGNSPLMVALIHKNQALNNTIVNFLVAKGAAVNLVNKSCNTPLIEAICNHRTDVVQQLVTAGADVNFADDKQNTPLHWSIFKNRLRVLRDLIQKGANVNIQNCHGLSPFHLAFKMNHSPIVSELIKNGADIKVLVNRQDQATALHEAARFEDPSMVNALMSSPDFASLVHEEDVFGNTPLYLAAAYGRTAAFTNFLTAGADINRATPRGKTPLLVAVESSDQAMVNLCLTHGAEVDVVDRATGCSPLMTAVSNGQAEIVKLLLAKAPNINLQNRLGQTALSIATNRAKNIARNLSISGDDAEDLVLSADSARSIVELLKLATK
jgi:ankyrin repeat protein